MSNVALSAKHRVLLRNISWQTCLDLSDQRAGSVPRMTYDQEDLELMSPSRPHEEIGSFIGRLVETYSEVREIEIRSVASTTFKRRELSRAFEVNESYYVKDVSASMPIHSATSRNPSTVTLNRFVFWMSGIPLGTMERFDRQRLDRTFRSRRDTSQRARKVG